MSDGSYSVSDIQDYIKHIIKNTTIPPIHVFINWINNKLVFKIKDGYKLELQAPEAMKLFDSRKRINRQKKKKKKTGEEGPSFELVEVVSVQCNLVDNQYQQKSEVLYIFTLNKYYAYLLIVETCNLVFLKTYNTDFDGTIITFTDGNGRPLEIKEKVILTLFINK